MELIPTGHLMYTRGPHLPPVGNYPFPSLIQSEPFSTSPSRSPAPHKYPRHSPLIGRPRTLRFCLNMPRRSRNHPAPTANSPSQTEISLKELNNTLISRLAASKARVKLLVSDNDTLKVKLEESESLAASELERAATMQKEVLALEKTVAALKKEKEDREREERRVSWSSVGSSLRQSPERRKEEPQLPPQEEQVEKTLWQRFVEWIADCLAKLVDRLRAKDQTPERVPLIADRV